MARVVEINSIEELAEYRMLWNSLLQSTPNATFFLTYDWLDTYWRHFGHDQNLKVLVVFAGGEALGILPLCVRTERYRLNTARVLTYPLDDCGTWYGPIGPNPSATMLAAMQHIRRARRDVPDWDMIELRWVADEGLQGGKTARALRVAGMLSEKSEYQTTSLVDLPTSWDDYLATKSRSLRNQFRRQLRHAFDEQGAEYIRHRPAPQREGDGDPRWDLYAMCEEVAAKSWQSNVTSGNTLTHERVRGFYRDSHAVAARLGMVDMNVMLVDGRPAAFLYSYHCDGRVFTLRMGYDPSFGEHGFGSALTLSTIRDGIARGDRTIDFGQGEREHKRRLRTRTEPTWRLTYAPISSWRSQAVRWTRWAKNHLPRQAAAAAAAV
jgi:CelD/BcsL family acetyltransferase involved in cellulose biosynthesis